MSRTGNKPLLIYDAPQETVLATGSGSGLGLGLDLGLGLSLSLVLESQSQLGSTLCVCSPGTLDGNQMANEAA